MKYLLGGWWLLNSYTGVYFMIMIQLRRIQNWAAYGGNHHFSSLRIKLY